MKLCTVPKFLLGGCRLACPRLCLTRSVHPFHLLRPCPSRSFRYVNCSLTWRPPLNVPNDNARIPLKCHTFDALAFDQGHCSASSQVPRNRKSTAGLKYVVCLLNRSLKAYRKP